MKNFFFCTDCLLSFYSSSKAYDCPECSKPMTVSGWTQELADNGTEKSPEGLSPGLAD